MRLRPASIPVPQPEGQTREAASASGRSGTPLGQRQKPLFLLPVAVPLRSEVQFLAWWLHLRASCLAAAAVVVLAAQ